MVTSGGPAKKLAEVAEAFVTLADALVDDFDIVELLNRLLESTAELLGATVGGLVIADHRGGLALMASSSEDARHLDLLQQMDREGPCLDSFRSKSVVRTEDLAADGERWPTFSRQAIVVGVRSVLAVPLRLRRQTIGALGIFDASPRSFSDDECMISQAFADVATIGLLQQRVGRRAAALAEQLQRALDERITIEQATGVVAARHDLDLPAAAVRIREDARHEGKRLLAIARELVDSAETPRG